MSKTMTLEEARALVPAHSASAQAVFEEFWETGRFTPAECLVVTRHESAIEEGRAFVAAFSPNQQEVRP